MAKELNTNLMGAIVNYSEQITLTRYTEHKNCVVRGTYIHDNAIMVILSMPDRSFKIVPLVSVVGA